MPDKVNESMKGVARPYVKDNELMFKIFEYEIKHGCRNSISLFQKKVKQRDRGERSHIFAKTREAVFALIPEAKEWSPKKSNHIVKEISRQQWRKVGAFIEKFQTPNMDDDYSGLEPIFNATPISSTIEPNDTAKQIATLIAAGAKTVKTPDGWEVSV
jgi:hypothetical protein